MSLDLKSFGYGILAAAIVYVLLLVVISINKAQ
jgi:hypothetical protein